jgi:hypothetical protein
MRPSIFQRLMCLILLLAFAATGTSVFSAAITVMAEIDGTHGVWVNQDEGGLHLILRHQQGHLTLRVCDHSSPLTRLVVTLCQTRTTGDHSFNAAELTGSLRQEEDGQKAATRDAVAADSLVGDADAGLAWHLNVNLQNERPDLAASHPALFAKHRDMRSVRMLI